MDSLGDHFPTDPVFASELLYICLSSLSLGCARARATGSGSRSRHNTDALHEAVCADMTNDRPRRVTQGA